MSDYEALFHFNRKPVSIEMVQYLASTTSSIIKVKKNNSIVDLPAPPLMRFIRNLISYSNVQTPTLMATTVYLTKLRSIIPANVYGIETTRHRIFLGCLILAAKTLNDSSPLNKHWASYTDGLLHIREVNTIERELLEYFDWNVCITTDELIACLSPFLQPIKEHILMLRQQEMMMFASPTPKDLRSYVSRSHVAHSRSSSNGSLPSLASSATLSTLDSRRSQQSYDRIYSINELEESPITPATRTKTAAYTPFRSPLSDKENIYNSNQCGTISKSDLNSKTRPIILKTGLDKLPAQRTNRKSNWQSIFR
ncbi:PHO85 interacting cyclin [Zygosaccharomyces mellis]|uniref:PHO85 interacting cyclin n=1 Tax=Zygosaccharomyces mellis TaxID=42258 RepID=A0A4C2E901_9SACH|nr:PHO85 interacting cyclin [Zygosaccharomyces mellis]